MQEKKSILCKNFTYLRRVNLPEKTINDSGLTYIRDLLSAGGCGNFPAFSTGPATRLRQPIGPRIQA